MKSKKSITEFLKEIPLFQVLGDEDFAQVLAACQEKKISRYSYVYMPDEKAEKVYFMKQGYVKIGTHSKDGKEVIKSVLYPNSMFGELCLVGEQKRLDFAQAMNNEVRYLEMDASLLADLMLKHHEFSLKLFSMIGDRLMSAERRLESMVLKDARSRIIEFLKESVRQYGQRIGYEMLIRHSLTQQDIANITGTSRQTVTSVLNDLKKSNLIYFNRRSILIRDMGNLA